MNLHYENYVRVHESGTDPRSGLWWVGSINDVRQDSSESRTFDTMSAVTMLFRTNDRITRVGCPAGFNISCERVSLI